MAATNTDWSPPPYWDEKDIEHWKSLDHTFCTRFFNPDSDSPAYEQCMSIHCHLCGKSTGSQGHLDFSTGTGICPTPIEDRKPWPTD